MAILILGLAIWWATHLQKIWTPGLRAAGIQRVGEGPWKGLVALASIGAIALMVIGYRHAAFVNLWYPPPWLWHLNNLLMVLAIVTFVAGSFDSPVRRWIRHPQLTAVKIWAVAHLLVNGDLASVVLFGGLLAWAVVAVIGTNRRDGPRRELPGSSTAGLVKHLVVSVVVFAVIAVIHLWLGVPPFPG